MFSTKLESGLLAGLLCLMSFVPECLAAPAGMDKAVQSYKSHQYAAALKQFEQISRAAPNDVLTHYYMALCLQALNQVSLAKQHYQWVAAYGDQTMKRNASYALWALSKIQASTANQAATASMAAPSASAKNPPLLQQSKPVSLYTGKLKVLEFKTAWCHVCRDFEGTWENVSTDFRRNVDFQQLDAEQPGNSDLVQKYNIKAYPTIIYTDTTGKVLARVEGAPTAQGMAQQLHMLGI